MKNLLPLAFALALLPGLTYADDAAPSAGSADSLAQPACKKPAVHTKMRQADDDSGFDEQSEAYSNCIKAYVAAQTAMAEKHTKLANDAIGAYNDFVKDVNAHNEK